MGGEERWLSTWRCAGSRAVPRCPACSNPGVKKVVCVWSLTTFFPRVLEIKLRVHLVDLCVIYNS